MTMTDKPLIIDEISYAYSTLKNMPFTPCFAIAELIDNATVALNDMKVHSPNLFGHIEVTYNIVNNTLSVRDNGIGFNKESRDNTIIYGTKKPKSGRNRYNVGMKNAIFWLSNHYTIFSYDVVEKLTYYSEVIIFSEDQAKISRWDVCSEQQAISQGTLIDIHNVRPLAYNIDSFKKNIVLPLSEIFRNDLEGAKYKLDFTFVGFAGTEIMNDVKPEEIVFQRDNSGLFFHKNERITIPGYSDIFDVQYRIMAKSTKHRLERSGFHFYYDNRKIVSFPVSQVLNNNTNIFKRSYVTIDISSNETQLSFLKDGLSINIEVQSTLFYKLRELFKTKVENFLLDLSSIEKKQARRGDEDRKDNGEKVSPRGKEINKSECRTEDFYTYSINKSEFYFKVFFLADPAVLLKVEQTNEFSYEIFLSSDFSDDEYINKIIIAIMHKHYNFTLEELICSGEIS